MFTISPRLNQYTRIFFYWLAWAILLTGILLRVVLWWQNRNLIIDEANITRNVYERGFGGLALPLSYEVYAPPVFLWLEKIANTLFGFGEKASRLVPLLCGIGSLLVFRKLLRKYLPDRSVWLPIALMALTYLLTKYSAEVKQYMVDVLVALLLVLFATQRSILTMQARRFFLEWLLIGTIAIWSSMPSVFVLAAVGCWYFWQLAQAKQWKRFGVLALVSLAWLVQFGIYYWFILKTQIESDYLQNYHFDYFLFATPANKEEWLHNWTRIREILNNLGGFSQYSLYATIGFLLIGTVHMLRRHFGLLLLAGVPVLLTLAAAALNQYSLIERLVLFMMPLLLIIFAFGVEAVMRVRFLPLQLFVAWVGVFMLLNFNQFKIFRETYRFQELTECFDYLLQKHANGRQVFIHDASVATYAYYTQIHPDRSRWQSLQGAKLLKWDSDYAQETTGVTDTVYFVYTGGFPDEERKKRTGQIEQHLQQTDYFERYFSYVFAYVPKTNP